MRLRVIAAGLAGVVLALGVTACGSSGGGKSNSLGLKSGGTINFAADFSVPPNQYVDNGTNKGIDVDMCQAIAGQLGVKTSWTNLAFDSLISGLQAHRYDALCTGVFITAAREKVMNMVPYVRWGVTMGIRKSDQAALGCTPVGANFDPCFARFSGKTVSTESGGFEEQTLQSASAKLSAAGKPGIHVLGFAQTTDAWKAFTNQTADAVWVDDPQFYYFNNLAGNKYTAAFGGVQPTPLALTTTKSNTKLAQAFVTALNKLKASGQYQKILTKWHVEAVPSFTINPPAA